MLLIILALIGQNILIGSKTRGEVLEMPSLRRLLLELKQLNVSPGEIELDVEVYDELLQQAEEITGQGGDEEDNNR
jgi:hypothetical protein